jgi:hypothetical protein
MWERHLIMFGGIPSAEMGHAYRQSDQAKWDVMDSVKHKIIRSDTAISNTFSHQQIGRQVYVV